MKRKSFITILAVVLTLVLSVAVLSACNDKKHEYSSEWKFDQTSHWHECTIKKHSDTSEKIAHDFNDGEVTKAPTEDAEGVKTFTCNTCGYQKSEAVAKLTHTHTFATEWSKNETEHWRAATCAHTTEKKDVATHSWNAGEVTTPATEDAEGVKTYTCTVCGQTKTETIDKLPHTHKYNTEVWEKDATSHWHPATCEHTGEKKDVATHSWDEGQVTKAPTETEEGEKTYTCLVCGQTKTESVGTIAHTHTFDTSTWAKDEINHWHPATCAHTSEKTDVATHSWNEGEVTTPATEEADGVKTYTCTVCGQTKIEAIPALGHEHTYATEWSKNDAEHWHAATCKHTALKQDVAAHSWNAGEVTTPATEDAEGVKTYTCTVCGQTKTEAIEKLPHTHKYNTEVWEKDATSHWHPATCEHTGEKKDVAAHSWNDGEVTTLATEEAEGVKTYTCTVCGQTKTEAIEKLPHTHKYNMTAWVNTDESGHYRPTTCGHEDKTKDFAEHKYTDDDDFDCNVCDYEREATIDRILELNVADKEYTGKNNPIKPSEISEWARGMIDYVAYKAKDAPDTDYVKAADGGVPKAVGEYTVKVVTKGNAVYRSVEKTADFAITQKEISLRYGYIVYVTDKRYEELEIDTRDKAQIVDGDEVLVKIDSSGISVGKNAVITSADKFTLTGDDAANYKISSVSCTVYVDMKTIKTTSTVKVNGVENSDIYADATIVYGATSFKEQGEENSIESYLAKYAVGKNVTINVYVKGNDKFALAQLVRVGNEYNVGGYTAGYGGPGTYTYDFAYNYFFNRQYVTKSVWVYDTDSVELVFDIVIEDPTNIYSQDTYDATLAVRESKPTYECYKMAIDDGSTSKDIKVSFELDETDADCVAVIYNEQGNLIKSLTKTKGEYSFTINGGEVYYVYVVAQKFSGTTDTKVTYSLNCSNA